MAEVESQCRTEDCARSIVSGGIPPECLRTYPRSPEDPGPVPASANEDLLAIVVAHGMGQQIPFETAGNVVEILKKGAMDVGASVKSITAEHVTMGKDPLPRVEVEVTVPTNDGTAERSRKVHIYEVYWAPLTEGQIGLKEVASFMVNAGLGGLKRSYDEFPFKRWMFGCMRDLAAGPAWYVQLLRLALWIVSIATGFSLVAWLFGLRSYAKHWPMRFPHILGGSNPPLPLAYGMLALLIAIVIIFFSRRTPKYLLFTLAVFSSLVVLNGTIVSIVGARMRAGTGTWPSDANLGFITYEMAVMLLGAGVLALIGLGLPYVRQILLRWRRYSRASLPVGERFFYRWMVFLALAVVVVFGLGVIPFQLAISANLVDGVLNPARMEAIVFTNPGLDTGLRWEFIVTVWALVIAASVAIRYWFVEYMGDVAIYVSSHTVNRFDQTRKAIKERAQEVICGVYGALDKRAPVNTPRFLYSNVIVMGHSLGSVIAYDGLNAAINMDRLLGGTLQVPNRTPLFLTFGSPLDKIAYIFRAHVKGTQEEREALAADVQPMIVSIAYRPRCWINVYSPDDWISGNLHFFSPSSRIGDFSPLPGDVINCDDDEACVPGVCHGSYWSNSLLREILFTAVRGTTPVCSVYLPLAGKYRPKPIRHKATQAARTPEVRSPEQVPLMK